MDCEVCHERPATLHLTNFINGKKTEVHVCQHCAQEKGYLETDEETYSIHDLLSGLFNFNSTFTNHQESNTQEATHKVCKHCGISYQQFAKIGKFGCGECYREFSEHLNPIFRRVHSGNTVHRGKIPKRQYVNLQKKRLLDDYRKELQRLIEQEKFEEAAEVRDKIKAIDQETVVEDRNKDGEA
ncbi:protein arginine kinase activator [Natronobacillus azotifigens]|uniref:UvrB/UvrC motif-containing protein n=1 Tax=Natronobacillus azotifigens TaxID=472978 RepID=A0A9J6RDT7_9BACI|nr:UvrB/UvrC motif-containing protein [Natronobacillus azotifigens]MCZ0703507.1 UvrB/UvrC motif-containing protein [Natronobacillus azotifigens]